MKSESVKKTIEANAEELRRLHSRIRETYRVRRRSDEHREKWSAACKEFHSRYDRLAFPGGYEGVLDRILKSDAEAVETALCFLELRPFFFRSGYMFKDILRKMKHANLSRRQSERLTAVVDAYDKYRADRRSQP